MICNLILFLVQFTLCTMVIIMSYQTVEKVCAAQPHEMVMSSVSLLIKSLLKKPKLVSVFWSKAHKGVLCSAVANVINTSFLLWRTLSCNARTKEM